MKLEILDKRPDFQTSPAFYTYDGDATIVAIAFENYQIVKNGEMKILYETGDGWQTLRTVSDLLDYGIDSDLMLHAHEKNGFLLFENNSWFEVWAENEDGETECVTDEVFFSIAEAYEWVEQNLSRIEPYRIYDKFAWEKEGRKKQRQASENALVGMHNQTLSYVHPQTTTLNESEFWKGWSKGVQDSIEKIRNE
jgi:hypothetical protein